MYRIKNVHFKQHPVLGDLKLDFTGSDGQVADTVIFAGDNGVGKSTIMNELYNLAVGTLDKEMCVIFEDDSNNSLVVDYYKKSDFNNEVFAKIKDDGEVFVKADIYKEKFGFQGVYSDVEINFHGSDISNVTSITLDNPVVGQRSSTSLSTEINQMLVDIQAADDAVIAIKAREVLKNHLDSCKLECEQRMERFTRAFSVIFKDLEYSRIENENNHKKIIFKKHGKDVSIDHLSSGEKQIIYRGCFLLRNVKSLQNSFVFIDEPEISMHPSWQMKIMDYYKQIFTDEQGKQNSQLFVVTHSPFIIHNPNRRNDKVIVLTRDEGGVIQVSDKKEYYSWNSPVVIEDAFNIKGFNSQNSYVFLEGSTDETYFNKAVEVYGFSDLPFSFKWIGYKDGGQDKNSGTSALDKAIEFIRAGNYKVKNGCLYDCDYQIKEIDEEFIFSKSIPHFENGRFRIGIENALVLDLLDEKVDIKPYYIFHQKTGDYGEDKSYSTFDKVKFCEHICSLDNQVLQSVFSNLKGIIENLKCRFTKC